MNARDDLALLWILVAGVVAGICSHVRGPKMIRFAVCATIAVALLPLAPLATCAVLALQLRDRGRS